MTRRLLLVASIVLPAAGCASDQPPAARWSAAQAVGPAFEVAPYLVTVHSPGQQIFTPPRVTWTGATAVAVWSDLWSGIWATQLGSTGGWTPPVSIARPNRVPRNPAGCSPFPCTGRPPVSEEAALVAVPGGVEAFWQQTDYTDGPGLWSATAAPGGAWSAPRAEQALPGTVLSPVARSAGSQAIAAWWIISSEDATLWAQRYEAGAPLDVAASVRSSDRAFAGRPAVDIDAAGTAVVVWSRLDSVHARWFSASGGWGPDRVLPRANGVCPVVALDGAGGAIAAWRETADQNVPSDSWITVTRLRPDTGWQSPESYSVPAARSGCPAIASTRSGRALLVWPNAGTSPGLWARAVGSAVGTAAQKVDDVDPAHEITSLRVAMDAGGNGYVAWIRALTSTAATWFQRPPSGSVRASRFVDAGARWEAPEALQGPSSSRSDVAATVDLAVHADGRAVAFWFEFENGMFAPWAARTVAR